MEQKMAYLVILCSTLTHVSLLGSNIFLYRVSQNGFLIFFSCTAVSYLLYPLLGWMADVCFTRFKFLLFSFITTILGSILGIITSALILQFPEHRLSLYYIGGLAIVIGLIAIHCHSVWHGSDAGSLLRPIEYLHPLVLLEQYLGKPDHSILWLCCTDILSPMHCDTGYTD